MKSFRKLVLIALGAALFMLGNLAAVGAQAPPPDFTKFGYPTVAKSMDITPDQAVTITAGDQSVAIKAGSFDNPVTFDLLTGDASAWKDQVKDRTVRAAFAFRITDKTTKALVGTFKQPVVYSYSGKDAASTDVILNTTAASPPAITVNGTPITFDGKVNHSFGGAGVGWLVASASTSGTASTPAVAAQASPGTGATAAPATRPAGSATTSGTTVPATTAATPAATGTGGATTLPTTGNPTAPGGTLWLAFAILASVAALTAGFLLRRHARPRW